MKKGFRALIRAGVFALSGVAAGVACAVIDAASDLSCPEATADCNENKDDGCEVNLNTDVNHCEVCNNECTYDHAVAMCDDGACGISECQPGWANANNELEDGCEAEQVS